MHIWYAYNFSVASLVFEFVKSHHDFNANLVSVRWEGLGKSKIGTCGVFFSLFVDCSLFPHKIK